jgi:hypothetical protein
MDYNKYKRLLFNGENSNQETYNLQQWGGLNFNFNDKVESITMVAWVIILPIQQQTV